MAFAKRVKARNGERQAQRLLSEAEVREALRPSPEALEALRLIAKGKAVRNSQAIVAANKLMLEFSQPKPKQEIGHSGSVSISVVNPYAEPPKQEDGE